MAPCDPEDRSSRALSRRQFLRAGAVAGLGGMILAACGIGGGVGDGYGAAPPATSAPAASGGAAPAMEQLVAAAKQEGKLTTIALPHTWANYGEMLDNFKKK